MEKYWHQTKWYMGGLPFDELLDSSLDWRVFVPKKFDLLVNFTNDWVVIKFKLSHKKASTENEFKN